MPGVRAVRRGRSARAAGAGLLGAVVTAVLTAGPASAILPPPRVEGAGSSGGSGDTGRGPVSGPGGGGGTAVNTGTKKGPPPGTPVGPPLSVPPGGPPQSPPPLSGSPPPAGGPPGGSGVVTAPEIDPNSLAAGLTLAAGGLLILTDKLRRK